MTTMCRTGSTAAPPDIRTLTHPHTHILTHPLTLTLTHRYKDVRRVAKMGDHTLIGASGEMSDFQSIMAMMDTMHQVCVLESICYVSVLLAVIDARR